MRKILRTDPVLKAPSEHEEQRLVVEWFRRTYQDVRIFAIPNGGARSIATAGRLKAEGVSPGVPDLFVPAWGLWIEMKRATGGRVSAVQKDWIEYLIAEGYHALVCHGFDDARRQIGEFRKKKGGPESPPT